MITLLMLPFFLVIRLLVDDNFWLYGPEYTYSAYVSIVNVDEQRGLRLKAFDMSSILKCRPRIPDTLSCRFDNTDMRFYQQGLADLGENSIKVWDISEEPFEVRFDRIGVSELVVSKSMPNWVIGGLKAIVNQLNIGIDLGKKQDGTFTTVENSYIGECETDVQISRKRMQKDALWRDDIFEIAAMPGFNKASGEVVEIEKWRNLEECKRKADYFFGSRDVPPNAYSNTPTKMTHSISHILISDTNYTSSTANEILVSNLSTGTTVKLHEKITLRLDIIAPDRNEYPLIEKSGVASLFVRGHRITDSPDMLERPV